MHQSFLLVLVLSVVREVTPTNDGQQSADFSFGRSLQSTCTELEAKIVNPIPFANPITLGIENSCSCSETSEAVVLSCEKNNVCISSNGADPMKGDFSDTYSKDLDGSSFSQTTTVETCFDYPDNIFEGKTVCLTYLEDGLGTVLTCTLKVGDDTCSICRFCPLATMSSYEITYDCSNIGYDDRTGCAVNNTDGSLLQFLFESEIVSGCTSGSSTVRPTSFPTAMIPSTFVPTLPSGASIISTLMVFAFSTFPVIFMG